MTAEVHCAEAISGFAAMNQTGTQAFGNCCGYVVRIGQAISKELSTNLFAAIPTIAALNLGLVAVLDIPASWVERRYQGADQKLRIWQGIFIYGTIFTSVALFNIGLVSPFIHTLPKLVSVTLAIAAVAARAFKYWFVNVYLPSKQAAAPIPVPAGTAPAPAFAPPPIPVPAPSPAPAATDDTEKKT